MAHEAALQRQWAVCAPSIQAKVAVHDAGARAQAGQRLDDQREALGEVIAGTAVEPHLCAHLAGDDPKAIVLDLMQPFASLSVLLGRHGEMNPAGRVRCNIVPIAKGYIGASQRIFDAASHPLEYCRCV